MELNHFDNLGNAVMVDISNKKETQRVATAIGKIYVGNEIMTHIKEYSIEKGDVLGIARIAGIMAIKKTSDIIPLCHLVNITKADIEFELLEESSSIKVICNVKTEGKTGVEMEALHGASVALLTIYDMCKAVDKTMYLDGIRLVRKSGGKSGEFIYNEADAKGN